MLGSGTKKPLVKADKAETMGHILRATVGPAYTTAENTPIHAWQSPMRITVTWGGSLLQNDGHFILYKISIIVLFRRGIANQENPTTFPSPQHKITLVKFAPSTAGVQILGGSVNPLLHSVHRFDS